MLYSPPSRVRLRGCDTPFQRRTLGNGRLCRFWRPPRFLNSPEQQCYPNITIDDYSRRIDKFVYDLKGLFRDLGHAVVKYEYELRERGKKPETAIEKNAKVYNVRRKVGGKGPRTEFKKRQFRAFERFLTASNYDGEMKRLNSLAAQCWFKNKTKWDAAVKASGQSKGYSSAKVLANSYRNSE